MAVVGRWCKTMHPRMFPFVLIFILTNLDSHFNPTCRSELIFWVKNKKKKSHVTLTLGPLVLLEYFSIHFFIGINFFQDTTSGVNVVASTDCQCVSGFTGWLLSNCFFRLLYRLVSQDEAILIDPGPYRIAKSGSSSCCCR